MRASPLVHLLCNAGLPGTAYHFQQYSIEQRASLVQAILRHADAIVTEAPSVTMVELEAEHTLYLITQPGHFAHPSILRRALQVRDGQRCVEVSGFTAATPASMTTWIEQFREQDTQLARSLASR